MPPSPIASLAADAIAMLDALEDKLDLDIVIRPNDKRQIRALNRVSRPALKVAAQIVTAEPARFPDFATLAERAAYVEAMTPVAARLAELVSHLRNSIQNQRTPAAQQTLALYGVVKSLGRVVDNETMREKVTLLREEVAPKRKNAPPKQTKTEKAAKDAARYRAGREAKARAVLGLSEPATATPTLPSPPPLASLPSVASPESR